MPYSDQLYVGRAPPTVPEVELLLSFFPFFPTHLYGENWHNPVIHLTGVRPYINAVHVNALNEIVSNKCVHEP